MRLTHNIILLIALSSMPYVQDCKAIQSNPRQRVHVGNSPNLTGTWTGSLVTQEGEKIVDIGFKFVEDAGIISGWESLPIGEIGELSPIRTISGTRDGGLVSFVILNPYSSNTDASDGDFAGWVDNDVMSGSYTTYPFSVDLSDTQRKEFEGFTARCELHRKP